MRALLHAFGDDLEAEAAREPDHGRSDRGPAGGLARALANVLRNAVRYARSRVSLSIERSGNRTVINVDDDGPGVPPAERQRLFEPFTRIGGSRERDSGGVGLGLAIVKSVAEWHGGEALISDSPLGGARITITW